MIRPPRICACGRTVPAGITCQCVRDRDRARGSASARGYDSNWHQASQEFLRRPGNEYCACGCEQIANIVDHIVAPKGDMRLFWDVRNWQPYRRGCNSRKNVRFEGGFGRAPMPQAGGGVENLPAKGRNHGGPHRRIFPNSVPGSGVGGE